MLDDGSGGTWQLGTDGSRPVASRLTIRHSCCAVSALPPPREARDGPALSYLFASCCSKSPHCLKSSPQVAIILSKTKSTSSSSIWNANICSTNIVSFIKILTIHSSGGVLGAGCCERLNHLMNCFINEKLTRKVNAGPF